jgi:hypothetical protein
VAVATQPACIVAWRSVRRGLQDELRHIEFLSSLWTNTTDDGDEQHPSAKLQPQTTLNRVQGKKQGVAMAPRFQPFAQALKRHATCPGFACPLTEWPVLLSQPDDGRCPSFQTAQHCTRLIATSRRSPANSTTLFPASTNFSR